MMRKNSPITTKLWMLSDLAIFNPCRRPYYFEILFDWMHKIHEYDDSIVPQGLRNPSLMKYHLRFLLGCTIKEKGIKAFLIYTILLIQRFQFNLD
jgi:hypothetical protein